jgi:hypothetical protein
VLIGDPVAWVWFGFVEACCSPIMEAGALPNSQSPIDTVGRAVMPTIWGVISFKLGP